MRWKRLLFDLDGTITDPKVGITKSVQYALEAFGIIESDADRLTPFIGPPLQESFEQFYQMSKRAGKAGGGKKYRERFSTVDCTKTKSTREWRSFCRNCVRKGVRWRWHPASRPSLSKKDFGTFFKSSRIFSVVVGSELDGRRVQKEEVVAEALRQLNLLGDAGETAMIGDRRFDIEGAQAHRLTGIGVAYGYALPGNWKKPEPTLWCRMLPNCKSCCWERIGKNKKRA